MKKIILFSALYLLAAAVHGQKWDDLSDEQKLMKLKSFRADNQKYLKDSLKLTQTQMDDIDNVNICYLSTLDRVNRYAKDDETKNKIADFVSDARWAQVDAIMGADKHERYMEFIKRKIEKAQKTQQK